MDGEMPSMDGEMSSLDVIHGWRDVIHGWRSVIHGWRNAIHGCHTWLEKCHPWMEVSSVDAIHGCHPWMKTTDDRHGRSLRSSLKSCQPLWFEIVFAWMVEHFYKTLPTPSVILFLHTFFTLFTKQDFVLGNFDYITSCEAGNTNIYAYSH